MENNEKQVCKTIVYRPDKSYLLPNLCENLVFNHSERNMEFIYDFEKYTAELPLRMNWSSGGQNYLIWMCYSPCMKRFLIPVMVVFTILFAGCISLTPQISGSTAGGIPTVPPTPAPSSVLTPPASVTTVDQVENTTVVAPSPSPVSVPAENTQNIESELVTEWRNIRIEWDTYHEKLDKLNLNGDSQSDLNYARETVIPRTISRFQSIRDNVSHVSSQDTKLQNETEALTSIASYKILMLEGYESFYQGVQAESYDVKKAILEYKTAKYTFQDAVDVINEAPDVKKFHDYLLLDKSEISTRIGVISFTLDQLNAMFNP